MQIDGLTEKQVLGENTVEWLKKHYRAVLEARAFEVLARPPPE